MTIPQNIQDFEAACQDTIFSIVQSQAAYLLEHGKYQQLSYELPDGSIKVDEYVGPYGVGYIVQLHLDGWIKSIDFGPEGRSTDWHQEEVII